MFNFFKKRQPMITPEMFQVTKMIMAVAIKAGISPEDLVKTLDDKENMLDYSKKMALAKTMSLMSDPMYKDLGLELRNLINEIDKNHG